MIEQPGLLSITLYAADWSAGSKYEHKRSKTLLKVKTFYDEDLLCGCSEIGGFYKKVNVIRRYCKPLRCLQRHADILEF